MSNQNHVLFIDEFNLTRNAYDNNKCQIYVIFYKSMNIFVAPSSGKKPSTYKFKKRKENERNNDRNTSFQTFWSQMYMICMKFLVNFFTNQAIASANMNRF